MTASAPTFRWHRDGSWLAHHPIGPNPDGEIEIDGDVEAPNDALHAVVLDTLPSLDDLVDLAVAHLRTHTPFGPDALWYPEAAHWTTTAGDHRLVLTFSIEDDFYGQWSVTLHRHDREWQAQSSARAQH